MSRGFAADLEIVRGTDVRFGFQMLVSPPHDVINPDGSVTTVPGTHVDYTKYTFKSQFRADVDDSKVEAEVATFTQATIEGDTWMVAHIPNAATRLMTKSGVYDVEATEIATGEVEQVAYGKYTLYKDATRSN